jgi:hypothetical protein
VRGERHTELVTLVKSKAVSLLAMEALEGRGGLAPTISGPRQGGQGVTPCPRFTPRERIPGTHCTGGWVDTRAGLDREARGKSFASAGDRISIAQSSSP